MKVFTKTTLILGASLFLLQSTGRCQQIRGVTVVANPPAYSGACPAKITFTATIHSMGAGVIRYQWLRSDGAHAPVQTLQLKGSGMETVTTNWQLGKSFSGWQALKIISPTAYESPKANFSITCGGAVASPVKQPPHLTPVSRPHTAVPAGKPATPVQQQNQ